MYNVNVYQTDAIMAATDCKRTLPWEQLLVNTDELLRKIGEEKFLYIFQYGMVGFFNLSKDNKKEVFDELKQLSNGFNTSHNSKELNIVVKRGTGEISFDKMTLPDFDSVALRRVLHVIIQFVAIDKYSQTTEQLLSIITSQNNSLKKSGKLNISHSKLKMHIGTVFSIKYEIAENERIFNNLGQTYGHTEYNNSNLAFGKKFGPNNGFQRIKDRMKTIQENLELFKAILDQKESSRLEWIIIILIAVEIIDLFVLRFFKWLL